tara:strand:+ start:925 stop:1362 length:438 start_codon:yes stop_codon:yes gene_type:complete
MATEQEIIAFCKAAAEMGHKPSELVAAYRSKEAVINLDIGEAVKGLGSLAVNAPIKALGLTAALGAAGGAGLAGIKNLFRNEHPHLFANEATPASPELKEERMRQLIARYRNAAQKIKDMQNYELDVQSPEESPMMRYEFGGFGD